MPRLGWLAPLLFAPSLAACVGSLEYVDPTLAEAAREDEPDAGAAPPPTPLETEPERVVELDPAALDAIAGDLTAAGLTPARVGPHALSALLDVSFDVNSARLRPESEPALDAARRLLELTPRVTTARIAVHSDSRGSSAYNERLTAARALAVAVWLVRRGVGCERLEAVGYGEDRPIADNVSAGGSAQNRRVELWITGVDGETQLDSGGSVAGSPCDPMADPDATLRGE